MTQPYRNQPADWAKYETNEVSPGIYQLTEEQIANLLRESADEASCSRCGGLVFGSVCGPCDMLQSPHDR